jgi:hypothetical protein
MPCTQNVCPDRQWLQLYVSSRITPFYFSWYLATVSEKSEHSMGAIYRQIGINNDVTKDKVKYNLQCVLIMRGRFSCKKSIFAAFSLHLVTYCTYKTREAMPV